MSIPLQFLELEKVPIFEQLLLEEYLLKETKENWVLINDGSDPAIVLGISGKPHELVDGEKLSFTNLPLIRRFSGGGTVVVDENTLFVTFIFHKTSHSFAPYPEPIMRWSETFYASLFANKPFKLQENDYILGDKKVGGNAQYIGKEKWVHHTSWLWDFEKNRMDLLCMPKKTPSYRQGRDHHQFLTKLSDYYPSKWAWKQEFKKVLFEKFSVTMGSIPEGHLEGGLENPRTQKLPWRGA